MKDIYTYIYEGHFPNLRKDLDLDNVLVEDLKFKLLDKVIWGGRGGGGSEVA